MLTTKRLIIRPIEKADYDDICEYGCDEETGRFMLHWPRTREKVEKHIENCINKMNLQGLIRWYEFVMVVKDEQKVIGNITLETKGFEAQLGWISNKRYWNKGYMSEAVNAIIEHAFDKLGVKRIYAISADENIASFKVMEKCNMVRIKTDNNYKSYKRGFKVTYNRLVYCIDKRLY